jgi:hypothetical protein
MKVVPNISVYIMTRDRVSFLREALNSLINQYVEGFTYKIIISDNSTSKEVARYIEKFNINIEYIYQGGMLAPDEHLQVISKSCSSEYMVLFHDDDYVESDFLYLNMLEMKKNQNLGAVCFNSVKFRDGESAYNLGWISRKRMIIQDECDIYKRYLLQDGVPAFSGYFYRTAVIKKIDFLNFSGIHIDAEIIASVVSASGGILWVPNVRVHVRVHNGNGSFIESLCDRRKLIKYINKNTNCKFQRDLYRIYLQLSMDRKNKRTSLFPTLFSARCLGMPRSFLYAPLIFFITLKRVYSRIVAIFYK